MAGRLLTGRIYEIDRGMGVTQWISAIYGLCRS